MRVDEIREIVKLTINELLNGDTDNTYQKAKIIVEYELKTFFNSDSNNDIGKILNHLMTDDYIDIIFLYYRDGKTLDCIADYYNKDTTTIIRNRKRLIMEIYELMQ